LLQLSSLSSIAIGLVASMDSEIHFLSMHWNALGRFDAQSHFVASDLDDGDDDVIVNADGFVTLAAEN
jgi:hypothetical protein